jgi:hypothetical protein
MFTISAPRRSQFGGGTAVKGGRIWRWLPWALAALVMVSGCSGILMEKKGSDGQVDQLKLDAGESWAGYDTRPRDPYASSGRRGIDDMSIMLKTLTTF